MKTLKNFSLVFTIFFLWGSASFAEEKDKKIGSKLKELYGGESVQREGDYRQINRALFSPHFFIIGHKDTLWKINSKASPQSPAEDWEEDLSKHKGLHLSIQKFLEGELKEGDWSKRKIEISELWITSAKNGDLVLTITVAREVPRAIKEAFTSGKPIPKYHYNLITTAIASKDGPNWNLMKICSGLTRFPTGSNKETCNVWDIVDIDEDGLKEILIQYHANESHTFHVYSNKTGSYRKIFEGGGYGL